MENGWLSVEKLATFDFKGKKNRNIRSRKLCLRCDWNTYGRSNRAYMVILKNQLGQNTPDFAVTSKTHPIHFVRVMQIRTKKRSLIVKSQQLGT